MTSPSASNDKPARAAAMLASPAGPGGVAAAVGLLEEALAEGSGEAAHRLAALAGAGVGQPSDWRAAMALLARAAQLGFAPAQDELRLLAGEGGADWPVMAASFDLAAWLAPPARRSLCDSPRVRTVEGFLPAGVCDWLIARARGGLTRALTYSQSGDARLESGRTNSETDFNISQTDVVLELVRARMAAATGLPVAAMELTKVLHYAPGQAFSRHFDWLDPAVAGHAAEIALRGQRIATFLIYLNDDYDGGETEFLGPGIRHRGKTGDGLYFANVDLAGEPDRRALHQGVAPTRGEKWLLSQWVRNRPQ